MHIANHHLLPGLVAPPYGSIRVRIGLISGRIVEIGRTFHPGARRYGNGLFKLVEGLPVEIPPGNVQESPLFSPGKVKIIAEALPPQMHVGHQRKKPAVLPEDIFSGNPVITVAGRNSEPGIQGCSGINPSDRTFCEFKSHQLVNPMDTDNPDAWHNGEPTHITCLDGTKENYEQFTRHMIQSPPGAIVIFVSQSDDPQRQPRCWHCAVFDNSKYEIDDETKIQTPIQTPSLEARGSVPRKKNIFQSIW